MSTCMHRHGGLLAHPILTIEGVAQKVVVDGVARELEPFWQSAGDDGRKEVAHPGWRASVAGDEARRREALDHRVAAHGLHSDGSAVAGRKQCTPAVASLL